MITNIKEAAKYLGISGRTVIRMINEDIFPKPAQSIEIGKGKILEVGTKRIWMLFVPIYDHLTDLKVK